MNEEVAALKAVIPWTWIRCIREYGPKDIYFWAAMTAIVLRMHGRSGECFIGVEAWAREARINGRTIRKCRDRAIQLGWLHCADPIRPRTKTRYRACVPAEIPLSEKDEELSVAVAADYGEIESDESVVPRVPQNPKIYGTQSATDLRRAMDEVPQIADSKGDAPKSVVLAEKSVVPTPENDPNLWHSASKSVVPRVPYKSSAEVLKTEVCKSEGTSAARSTDVRIGISDSQTDPDAELARKQHLIRKAREADPRASVYMIANHALRGQGISVAMVKQCEKEDRQKANGAMH